MTYRSIALAVSVLIGAGAVSHAGDLDPPAGPVAPTGRTLTEVRPSTPIDGPTAINQPGAYHLTGNIDANDIAIIIEGPDITLDLGGFVIDGSGVGQGGDAAIYFENTARNTTIRNGSITNWPQMGIDAAADPVVTIEDVRFRGCAGTGVFVSTATIQRCSADACGVGFSAAGAATLIDCRAESTTSIAGFDLASGSRAVRCVSIGATGYGFRLADDCTAESCSALGGAADGFFTGNRCHLIACRVDDHASEAGFRLDDGSILESCSVQGCAYGVLATQDILVRGCTVQGATFAGISIFQNGQVDSCEVTACDGGIRLGESCLVRACNVSRCAEVGIVVEYNCTIEGCNVRGATGADAVRLADPVAGDAGSNRVLDNTLVPGMNMPLGAAGVALRVETSNNVIGKNFIQNFPGSGLVFSPGSLSTTNRVGPFNDLSNAWSNFD